MRKIKYLFILLSFFLLSIYLYQSYIYYKIPYNPLAELTTNNPIAFYFEENHPDHDMILKSSHDLNTNKRILEYFSDLDLIPFKKEANMDEIFEHEKDIYFSGMFSFDTPDSNIFINEIYLDNLTILSIRSDRQRFKNGYYKIIDGKFDYKHINDLIANSKN